MEKTNCVKIPAVRSTMTLAPAMGPGRPRRYTSRARRNSPPTRATGSKAFTESAIQRIQKSRPKDSRPGTGRRTCQEKVSNIRMANRKRLTQTIPQPMVVAAARISAAPYQTMSAVKTAPPTARLRSMPHFIWCPDSGCGQTSLWRLAVLRRRAWRYIRVPFWLLPQRKTCVCGPSGSRPA